MLLHNNHQNDTVVRVTHYANYIIAHQSVSSMYIIPQNYIPYNKFLTSIILYASIFYYLNCEF